MHINLFFKTVEQLELENEARAFLSYSSTRNSPNCGHFFSLNCLPRDYIDHRAYIISVPVIDIYQE